jgi:hypothetical protein
MYRACGALGFSVAGAVLLCAACNSAEPTQGSGTPLPTSSGANTADANTSATAPPPTSAPPLVAPPATETGPLPSVTAPDATGATPTTSATPSGPVEIEVPPEPEPVVDPLVDADVGSKVIHRLSNIEYDNTVAQLLGTELAFGDVFLREEAEGFDNIATSLSMSPRQVEDYFRAAGELAELALTTPELKERIVNCTLDEVDLDCARTSIEAFGKRGTDGAMQHVVQVVLSAPHFLYRIEFDSQPADGTAHPLSDWELASRLSYALWSSMPDESLFALAEDGSLSSPEVLDAEVDRMLSDPRAEMLAINFAGQWLGARRLTEHVASETVYPEWSPELAQSMQREMELYFSEFLNNDLPYSEFLSTDMNFVDENLREHYDMAAGSAEGFEKVTISDDEHSGFLGLAGFLTQTSRETRSSPIIRGSWLLNSFWCLSLKLPAGVVVEPLVEPEEGSPQTVREIIAAHRADPACAACHNFIDPIGLSLEHFDGIGRYRSEYEDGLPIDSTAELPSGQLVDGLETLSAALSEDAQFLPCAASKFHTFAIGRAEVDRAYLNDIVTRWTSQSPTLKNMIKATVTSNTFTMRRAVTP